MKKYLIILLTILSSCSALRKPETSVSANHSNSDLTPQTIVSVKQSNSYMKLEKFKGDTLGYVQHNFVDAYWNYIGKDLNTLLNDLEIPIKSYLPGSTSLSKTIMPFIILQFYTLNQANKRLDSSDKPVDIIIKWSTPLPMDSVNILVKKNKGEWTEAERKYFGKQIIGDILTTKYDK